MKDYLGELATCVHDTKLSRLPASTVAAAKLVLLDTIGAMVAGSALPENVRLARMAAQRSPHGLCTLAGHGLKSDSLLATFTNATAGVALEMDEGNRFGGGHPAIHVIPGALAVAEEMGADGRRLLEAVIAGYEVGSRLGGATFARPNVHSHGTWGTISTAAAVARLNDLPADEIRHVINLSASMTPANSWTPALEGATIRNAYPGRSGLEGILALDLHRAGFTALDDAPSDVYGTLLAESFEPEAAVAGLGESYRIEQNYFKFHACCRMNHPALDAVMSLRAQHRFTGDEVASVHITSIPFGLRMLDTEPQSMLGPSSPFPTRWRRPRPRPHGHRGLRGSGARRRAHPRHGQAHRGGRGRRDGAQARRLSDCPRADRAAGWPDAVPDHGSGARRRGQPRVIGEVVGKFLSLASGVLGDGRAHEIIEAVDTVDTLKDVRDLTALLAPLQA